MLPNDPSCEAARLTRCRRCQKCPAAAVEGTTSRRTERPAHLPRPSKRELLLTPGSFVICEVTEYDINSESELSIDWLSLLDIFQNFL
ncbi:hypothetical protein F2P81_015235 [Scophthalmus maximus]|uniref:Uncharacterized protein n=1 Tax=Scophthalmus maximus TaxID=52904 RepID=A0A6A4SK93_SCOMX|nr:hypothetical protein F2P81_015235 [Scophthalmus maximus]